MQLVILSPYDYDSLREYVEQLFSVMPKRDLVLPPISVRIMFSLFFLRNHLQFDIYPKEVLGSLFRIIPVGSMKELKLFFTLPSQWNDTVKNSCDLLSSLIGHEGKGSILCLLRVSLFHHYTFFLYDIQQEGLATALSAGNVVSYSFASSFCIKVSLTEKGIFAYQRVLSIIFKYISSLTDRQALERFYHETADISHSKFRFEPTNNKSSYVTDISERLRYTPVRFVLHKTPFRQFDYDHLVEHLSFLTPANCVGYLCTNMEFMKDCVKEKEPWYDIEFGKMPIRCM